MTSCSADGTIEHDCRLATKSVMAKDIIGPNFLNSWLDWLQTNSSTTIDSPESCDQEMSAFYQSFFYISTCCCNLFCFLFDLFSGHAGYSAPDLLLDAKNSPCGSYVSVNSKHYHPSLGQPQANFQKLVKARPPG